MAFPARICRNCTTAATAVAEITTAVSSADAALIHSGDTRRDSEHGRVRLCHLDGTWGVKARGFKGASARSSRVMDDSGATKQHVFTHPSPVEHWRHFVEIVALVIAAAWGFYVFVYQERIKPAGEPPILDVQPIVMHELMRGGKEVISAGLVMKNIGPTDLKFAGLVINLYGLRFSPTPSRFARMEGRISLSYNGLVPLSRTLILSAAERDQPFGGSSGANNYFAPGRQKRTTYAVVVRSSDYDALQMTFAMCYLRTSDPTTFQYRPHRMNDGSWSLDMAPLFQARGMVCVSSRTSEKIESL